MAVMNINPTRMQLKKLKRRLATATRGHKLLKDKNDELMKQFLNVVRENMRLRAAVEEKVSALHDHFTLAAAAMSPEFLSQALLLPKQTVSIDLEEKNIMSVRIPEYHFQTQDENEGTLLPYGTVNTSGELDDAVQAASDLLPDLLALAQAEKAASMMAAEIERTRRRVNALEHVLIPQYRDTIRYITMKLDENERGNITRLMKVKDMMLAEAVESKRKTMNTDSASR